MRIRTRRAIRPALDRLDDRCLLAVAGLTPAQVTTAYGLDAIRFPTASGTTKGNGAGETIALIEAYHDPYLAGDLHTFDVAFGLPDPSLIVADQAGSVSNPSWSIEETLDVEWAHAIAPGAQILVVEAQSQSRAALLVAVNAARDTPGVVAISMSWGFPEFRSEANYNGYFTTPPGHQGITFVAASGDSGTLFGLDWPSAAPDVLAVGGTSLSSNSAGQYLSETMWYDSGGGYSEYEAEPSYQLSVQTSGVRTTPDVAFDADPNTGVAVYQSSPYPGQGGWEVVGGTSLGSPAWAAIIAIVDQGRSLEGNGSLDGATQTLPSLYALPSSDFNAIPPSFSRPANTSTGRGSPLGPSLVYDLVDHAISAPFTLAQPTARKATSRSLHLRKAILADPETGFFAGRTNRLPNTPLPKGMPAAERRTGALAGWLGAEGPAVKNP
ncbi:MAG: peptidase S8/S53 subtilisin kexin sedolisin [Isosphaeraceae bacterium]